VVGHLQLIDSNGKQVELRSLAVAPDHQGQGIGTALIDRAVAEARTEGRQAVLVATASADVDNLRFYQRRGFRMLRIERDAFMPSDGYSEGLTIGGVPLRDRVWFDLTL
jgi:GNAT superfamily N-acetyltransferase